ncbi:MAG: hypothetical protein ACRYG7_53395 [Janthinobacterium lividum]
MNTSFFRMCPTAAAVLLAALPLLATAQNTHQDSVLRGGDLVGGRPRPAGTRPTTASRAFVANADPGLAKIMHESIDVNRLPASQVVEVYSRFLESTRDQRRQWDTKEWDEASAALTHLNTRYEAVRLELPLDDRLTVRSYQGEFRTLQGARRVKDRLDESKSNR